MCVRSDGQCCCRQVSKFFSEWLANSTLIVLALARTRINARVHMDCVHDQSFTRIAERCTIAKQLLLNYLSCAGVVCSAVATYVCWLSNACQLQLFPS